MCVACNDHFKHLEDAVIPLLEPMAKGMGLVLGQESQQLLALWATKTTIALLAAEDPTTVPKAHAKTIRDEARVGDGTWVGFFPWRGDPVLWTTTASSYATANTGPVDVYGALLAFGAVGFCAFGIKAAPMTHSFTGEAPPLRQFWPLRHRMIEWPPGPPLDSTFIAGLRQFVRRAVAVDESDKGAPDE